jgi:hypothetical protein
MSHPDEGILLALLDGQLDDDQRRATERHVAECAACAAELRELRAMNGLFSRAVGAVEAPPRVAEALMAVRARRAGAWGPTRRALGKAAVLLVGFAGIAYAAVPGSAFRHWIARAVSAPAATAPAAPPPLRPAPEAKPAPAEAALSGVSITPEAGAVRVVFSGSSPDLRVRARVSEGERVEVTASGAAASARFRTGPGRIEVVGARAGEVTVLIPRSIRTAVVEANGRVLLSREDGRTRVLAPVVDDSAPGMVFRAGP